MVAVQRVAVARKIVADQHKVIGTLRAAGPPTHEEEKALQTYLSALRHLEERERKIREERRAKKMETLKKDPG
jgi:hypothetical protein